MKQWLMDILQCPICRNDKLSLRTIEVNGEEIMWGLFFAMPAKGGSQ